MECTNPPVEGKPFCQQHINNGCPIKSPLSGSEPDQDPDEYNGDKGQQWSHNCYAYAMGVKNRRKAKECRNNGSCGFDAPGRKGGHPEFSGVMGKLCSDVLSRTMNDIPEAELTVFGAKCKPGFSKVGVVVDEKNDFHQYRQDSNGMWSHKPGGREVTNLDSAGAPIQRPDLASRSYPKENENDSPLDYKHFCSQMCVPRKEPIVLKGGKTRRRSFKKSV